MDENKEMQQQHIEGNGPMRQKAEYMGYAYMKNSEKPQLVYGSSQEEILQKLNRWNQHRAQGEVYNACNIGTYNRETDRYEGFQKYDVATGQNITRIYLQMPRGLNKEEFNQTLQYFKENGARYSIPKKQWYVTPELQDKFAEYLKTDGEKEQKKESGKETAKEGEIPHSDEKVYLRVPKGLSKEKFDQTVQYLKENGARYDGAEKQWYIKPELQDKFAEYLKTDGEKEQKSEAGKETGKEGEIPLPDEKLYLRVPRGLSKEKFDQTVQYLKENGARYDRAEKQWYIKPELQDKFAEYLKTDEEKELHEELKKDYENHYKNHPPCCQYIKDIDKQFVVELTNGDTLRIGEREMMSRSGVERLEELGWDKALDVIEEKIAEHLRLIHGKEYDITVGNTFEDNRCTIYMDDGRVIDLYGDKYGVHFPSMEQEKIKQIVDDYMKQTATEKQEALQAGSTVKLYVPDYKPSETAPGFREVSEIREIEGVLKEIDADKNIYTIENEAGIQKIKAPVVYDERQAYIIGKALDQHMTGNKIDLVSDPKLSAAQMEQVYEGIRDGLSVYQVAEYANPSYASWQMDICRYGLGNGIPFDSIKEAVTMPASNYEDSRRLVDKMIKAQRNLIIKDIKNHGLVPEKQLVKKIEKLNGVKGRIHSIDEILKQEASGGTYSAFYKEVTSEIHRQKSLISKQSAPMRAKMPLVLEM